MTTPAARLAAWSRGLAAAAARAPWTVLGLILALGFVVRLAGWWLLPNIYRPDEVFQTVEPAYRMLTGTGVVTWEWREGLRGWAFPDLLAGIMAPFHALGLPPITGMAAIAGAMALLACGAIAAAFALGLRLGGVGLAALMGGVAAFWPDFVYFGPKPLSEVAAGHLLVVAACLADQASCAKPGRAKQGSAVAIGALLGVAFALRFHLAPALAAVALVFAIRSGWRWALPWLALGAAVPLTADAALDYATLGAPFQSVWHNFAVNVVQGRSLEFGQEGRLYYLVQIFRIWGAAAPVVLVCFVAGFRRVPASAWAALALLASHTVVAHKNYSFVYGGLMLLLLVAVAGSWRMLPRVVAAPLVPWRPALLLVGWGAACLGVGLSGDFPQRWRFDRDQAAMLRASHGVFADACAVGLMDAPWLSRAWLGRDTPIGLARTPAEQAALARSVSHVVVRRDQGPVPAGFRPLACFGDVCVAHAPAATCSMPAGFEINAVLAREGH